MSELAKLHPASQTCGPAKRYFKHLTMVSWSPSFTIACIMLNTAVWAGQFKYEDILQVKGYIDASSRQ